MILLVEGVDKSGKTTFIKSLSHLLCIPVYRKIPASDLQPDSYHTYFKGIGYALVELSNLLNFDLLVDRSFISDWVYSNKRDMNHHITIWHEWESRILPNTAVIVYLYVDKYIFEQRITQEPDEYMEPNDYDKFTLLYSDYLAQTRLPVIVIDGAVPFDLQLKSFSKQLEHLIIKHFH